jgi:endonuclease I
VQFPVPTSPTRALVAALSLAASLGCNSVGPVEGDTDRDGSSDADERDAGRTATDGAMPPADASVSDHDAGATDAGSAEPDAATDAGYYGDIDTSLRDQALVSALHDKLARDHVTVDYDDLYEAYATIDTDRAGCADIFDFYSDQCWTVSQACGAYEEEGDCFNREHLWPKSWWGGATGPDQHQDLFSVVPTDGFVNNVRANLPLGDTDAPDYTSSNGSRRGPCSVAGAPAGAVCFEPADTLKGDFARVYFYQATRYEGELACCDEDAVSRADIKPWEETLLRAWHAADPVDAAERERNERVFARQANRNPFVDLPSLVEQISDF